MSAMNSLKPPLLLPPWWAIKSFRDIPDYTLGLLLY